MSWVYGRIIQQQYNLRMGCISANNIQEQDRSETSPQLVLVSFMIYVCDRIMMNN